MFAVHIAEQALKFFIQLYEVEREAQEFDTDQRRRNGSTPLAAVRVFTRISPCSLEGYKRLRLFSLKHKR